MTAMTVERLAAWKRLKTLGTQPLDFERLALIDALCHPDVRRGLGAGAAFQPLDEGLARRTATQAPPDVGVTLLELIPRLGLNDEAIEEIPPALRPFCGQGLRIWQYPIQFAPYLAAMTRLGIRSYLEIGVRHGGTFVATVEILSRFTPIERAVAVDVIRAASLDEYARMNPAARMLIVNTQTPAFVEALGDGVFDLVLIDSLHEEAHCRNEFLAVRDRANVVAFHDIANDRYPGVARVWSEVRALGDYDCLEFTAQYDEIRERCMGIGVAIRKEWR